MACPFFVPRQMVNDGSWQHPSRLPLGAGWTGACCATAQEIVPDEANIRNCCNLGYASACPHLPSVRDWDAVRFCVAGSGSEQITLSYSCELNHAPMEHGTLIYDVANKSWRNAPADPRVERLAMSYLRAYRARQTGSLLIRDINDEI